MPNSRVGNFELYKMEKRVKKNENGDKRNDRALRDRGDVNRFVASERKYQCYDTAVMTEYPDGGDTQFRCKYKEAGQKKEPADKRANKRAMREPTVPSYAKVYNFTERRKLHDLYTFKLQNTKEVGKKLIEEKNDLTDDFNANTHYLMEYFNVEGDNTHVRGDQLITRKTEKNEMKRGTDKAVGRKMQEKKSRDRLTDRKNLNGMKMRSTTRKCSNDTQTQRILPGNQKNHDFESHAKCASSADHVLRSANCKQEETNPERKEHSALKKPIIRTITSENDATKVYKAVTFVDRPIGATYLSVNMPDMERNKNCVLERSRSSTDTEKKDTATSAAASSHGNRPKLFRTKPNPRITKAKKAKRTGRPAANPTPPEVPKWDPSCMNQHTKPYYEAWVNTQPTAMTLESDKEKIMRDNQEFIIEEGVQRISDLYQHSTKYLEDFNANDVRQTGLIKMTVKAPKTKSNNLSAKKRRKDL